MADRLEEIFNLRESFMELISEKVPGAYPSWPVDLQDKMSQKVLREITFRSVEELFEALLHLKNWKDHRASKGQFDREEYLEEMIDAFNYFLAILVLTGVDATEFFNAYNRKHEIIVNRLPEIKS